MSVEMKELKTRDDWLQNRYTGIGGSEISAVVGYNPYMNNVDLWEFKTGRRKPENISDKPYVQYGTQAEMHLRGLFRLDFPQYKVEYIEHNSWKNSKYPWAKASLDGWLTDEHGRRGVLEIKTTEILQPMQKERWNNRIPMNYYCQVLFYMAVIEAEFAVLKAQLKTVIGDDVFLQTKHYPIERTNVQADIDYLMEKGAAFWKFIESDQRPPLILPNV